MKIYKVFENIEMTFEGSGYPGVNTWLASFRSKEEAEDYLTYKKMNDYKTPDVRKRHYMKEED